MFCLDLFKHNRKPEIFKTNILNKVSKSLGILLSLFLVISCQKDDDCNICNSLNGTWKWVESIGGIGGWTLTPKTENKTKKLIINNFKYKEYENDSLIFQARYNFEIRPETYYDTHYYITLENAGEFAVAINRNELVLYENLWSEGFLNKYIRK